MSIIGPRPGLWNQDVLTAERDKYGANDVKPGLTGWAQINGRDELEISEKAKLDGEYVKNMGPVMDVVYYKELNIDPLWVVVIPRFNSLRVADDGRCE